MAATSQSYRYPPPPPPSNTYAPAHSTQLNRQQVAATTGKSPPPPPPPPRPAPTQQPTPKPSVFPPPLAKPAQPAFPPAQKPAQSAFPPAQKPAQSAFPPSGTAPTTPKKRKAPPSEPGRCDICKLTLNSDQQLQQHLQGKNHLKMLKKQETTSSPAAPTTTAKASAPQSAAATTSTNTSGDKLDPVSQAIYDNAMGKLPKKRRVDIHCDVCDIMLTSETHADSHFKGSKHARKLKLKEMMNVGNNETENSGDGQNKSGMGFFCNFCDMHLNSLQQLEAHRSGEKHRKCVEKKKNASIAFQKANPSPNKPKETEKVQCKTCDLYLNSMAQLQQHLSSKNHQEMLKMKGLLPGSGARPPPTAQS